MANTPWFVKEDYLASKLAQLIELDAETYGEWTTAQVEEAITSAGLTPEDHFNQFGAEELTSPNAYFDANYYLAAKAEQLNASVLGGQWTAEKVAEAFAEAGLTPWTHFQLHGWAEGVNPSADFDVDAYFEEKAALAELTVEEVKAAFAEAGLDPISHYYAHGEEEGITPVPVSSLSSLTEALGELAAAKAAAAAVLEEAAKAVNAAEDTPLEDDALDDFIAEFDEEALEAAIDDAEDAVENAELELEGAEGDLSVAQGTTFTAGAAALLAAESTAEDVTTAVDKNGDTIEAISINLGVEGASRMTDANVAQVLAAAKKAVNDDKVQYTADGGLATAADVTAGTTFTAKALQTAAIVAAANLNADVAAKGDNVALLTELRATIANLVDAGADLTSLAFDATTLGTVLSDVNGLLNADPIVDANVTAYVKQYFDTTATPPAAREGTLNTGNEALDQAFNDTVAKVANRAELIVNEEDTATVFENTLTGAILAEAQDLADAREQDKADVADAAADVAEAEELLAQLQAFQAQYDDAQEAVAAAEQYFADNDLLLPVDADGAVTATEGNDIFLYVESDATIAGFNLEGEDILFVGGNFTWNVLDAADDFAAGRFGDSAVFEIFAQQDGGNVNLYIETQAFGGSVVDKADIVEITLTGVNVEDLVWSQADGILA